MDEITLKKLRYFEALSRHGHFGRAAEACAVSQPALSVQIKELEEALGAPLFERGARSLRLTGLGEEFAVRARTILQSVEELGDLARSSGSAISGPFRLGIIPTIAPYLLPRLVGALGRAFPELDLRLRETVTPTLMEELSAGRLDAAVVALPLSEPAFTEEPLFSETFVLVRPSADADRPVPEAGELPAMRLLLLEEGHCFRDQALSFCDASAQPKNLMDGSSLSTLVQMVSAGIGVTLIPEMAVGVETRSADVAVQTFPDPEPTRMVGMVWRKKSVLADQLKSVAAVVRTAASADQPVL